MKKIILSFTIPRHLNGVTACEIISKIVDRKISIITRGGPNVTATAVKSVKKKLSNEKILNKLAQHNIVPHSY